MKQRLTIERAGQLKTVLNKSYERRAKAIEKGKNSQTRVSAVTKTRLFSSVLDSIFSLGLSASSPGDTVARFSQIKIERKKQGQSDGVKEGHTRRRV